MYTLVEFLRRISMDNIAKYLVNLGYEDLGQTSMNGLPNGGTQLHSFKSRSGGIPIMLPPITPESTPNIAAWLLFMMSTVIGKTPDQVLAGFIDATTITVDVTVVASDPNAADPSDAAGAADPANTATGATSTDPFSSP
jgi:hypothetical protein